MSFCIRIIEQAEEETGMSDEKRTVNDEIHEHLIGTDEAARILGVSRRTLYRLIDSGQLPPPVKIGRSTRIVASEITDYIEALKAKRKRSRYRRV